MRKRRPRDLDQLSEPQGGSRHILACTFEQQQLTCFVRLLVEVRPQLDLFCRREVAVDAQHDSRRAPLGLDRAGRVRPIELAAEL